MKRKLCPFDKTECAGDLCMVFCEDTGSCGFFYSQTGKPSHEAVKAEIRGKKKPDTGRKEAIERKSQYRAELFD
jgi:hypothetical protein